MALDLGSVGKHIGPIARDYGWKDVILYALGVGAGFGELEYCYENRLKVIPSFAIAAIFDYLAEVGITSGVNLAGVLHGEQDLIFHNPIPPEGRLITEGKITGIYDKGADKGAIIIGQGETRHSDGQKLFTNVITIFGRLDGGFGGPDAPRETFEFPDRPPDSEETAQPSPDQPLLYRLSGDVFALHVDPAFARASGFEKPIMHGLCTHGFACRAVIKHLFPGEPERMTRFRNRFSRTIYPGKEIKTQIWKLEEGKALFRTVNPQTDEVVIDRGVVEWISSEEAARRSSGDWIRFDDRVAVVTGAGAGLGRSYAIELARRGAKVVVNDLGGARDGSGNASTSAADSVVQEIKGFGGEAVANYDSVATSEGGQSIVDMAIKTFGRLDILVNNAGILRDKTLAKMEPADWRSVMAVHLDAAYNVTRPAFQKMRENRYGRVIVTTSAAGLHGNFGQTNYSAAKMALIGFMNTLKLEGEKHDIKVNAVAPVAATRLTEDILPPDLLDRLKPEFVTPLVLYLCSDQCPVTGRIYNAGMGWYSRAAIVTGPGAMVGSGGQVPAAEQVAESISAISSLENAAEYHNLTEAVTSIFQPPEPRKPAAAEPASKGMTVEGVFDRIAQAFQPDRAEGVDVVFQYKISGPTGGDWHVAVANKTCQVTAGVHPGPTTTILMADEDFLALIQKKLNAMQAYSSGKLKIQGDLMKSQLIEKLFKF